MAKYELMTDSERKAAALYRKQQREEKVRAGHRCLLCSAEKGQPCEGKQNGITVDMMWSHRTRYDQFRMAEQAAKRKEKTHASGR